MAAMNDAATTKDPKESILRFANKKASPKNSKCSLSAAFMFRLFRGAVVPDDGGG